MTANILNLEAQRHSSHVLDAWLAGRQGSAERAGIQASMENGTVTNLNAEQLAAILGFSSMTNAGVAITPETALRVSTVYGCVSLIAGTIASLPLGIYERDGDTRQKVNHDYWWFLNERANENMTSAAAWEYIISSKLFYGDGFARLLRPGFASARVIGIEPLHPLRVTPFKDEDGRLYYRVQPERGATYVLDQADMLHFPSLGFDGKTSPSPITYAAREALGISMAAEAYNARFFSQGATFDYALKTAANLKPDQAEILRASLLARQGGLNSRSPLILTGGLEPAQLSVNPKDAEVLATRLFGVEEICRILGVPPYMVGHMTNSTSFGTGIEQQGIGFVRYTLQRHLTPAGQEINSKLWPIRQKYFVEYVAAALERGDLKSRYEAYRIALGRAGEMPWMDSNEIRRLENQPPNDNLQRNGGVSAQPTTSTAG